MPGNKGFQWTVALVLFGVLFLGVSDTQLVAPLLPLIARDLGITPGRAGMIVTTYSLTAALFALLIGPISDRIGRKKVLVLGLVLFSSASLMTYYVTSFSTLLIVRMLTGLSAGTLSTGSLSYAADHYHYSQRGRAMGVISMAYFFAFVVGIPAGALMAARFGWHMVFAVFAGVALFILVALLKFLPNDTPVSHAPYSLHSLGGHFFKPDRLSGIAAAFLTSGGIVGFMTYVGAWLTSEHGLDINRVALVFMASGIAAVAASPFAGWLSDHLGKKTVIVWANIALALLFVLVTNLHWGIPLVLTIAALSIAASARQAPLHALTTEIVESQIRGEYIAVRNAASQLGIASIAAMSASIYDRAGFSGVGYLAAFVTILIPLCCIRLREPR